MQHLSLSRRAQLYNSAFPDWPDSHLRASDRWLQGNWIMGNDYRGTGLYGSYPPGYLKRVTAIFPDATRTLHLFSGSLPRAATRTQTTVDIRRAERVEPGIRADVHKLPFLDRTWDLALADTPYSDLDAEHYGTPMPDRRKVLYEIYRVVEPGGFLVWLDTVLPMYSKLFWQWCGAIGMWRSTNHRVRGVMIFQRLPQPGETFPNEPVQELLLEG